MIVNLCVLHIMEGMFSSNKKKNTDSLLVSINYQMVLMSLIKKDAVNEK